jgi:hypothetical protein
VQKSNTKVSAAKHQAVLAGGGKEIPRGAVIYNQSGKMYMFDPGAAGNEAASANFQDSTIGPTNNGNKILTKGTAGSGS